MSYASSSTKANDDESSTRRKKRSSVGRVRSMIHGIERSYEKVEPESPVKQVRFEPGIVSPPVTTEQHGGDRVEVEPTPGSSERVPAQLLSASEGNNRGLQKTNDRLHEELVANELKTERLEAQLCDHTQELEIARSENADLHAHVVALTDELQASIAICDAMRSTQSSSSSSLASSEHSTLYAQLNQDNNRALERVVKDVCDSQLKFLNTVLNSSEKKGSSRKKSEPLRRRDENAPAADLHLCSAAHKKLLQDKAAAAATF